MLSIRVPSQQGNGGNTNDDAYYNNGESPPFAARPPSISGPTTTTTATTTMTRSSWFRIRILFTLILLSTGVLLVMKTYLKENNVVESYNKHAAINLKKEKDKNETSLTKKKKKKKDDDDEIIAYLSMGKAGRYPILRDRFQKMGSTKVKFYYHSYDEPCEGCIFRRGTSFASGRHLLLRTALLDSNLNIKYYVLIDDDVDLICGNNALLKRAATAPQRLQKKGGQEFDDYIFHSTTTSSNSTTGVIITTTTEETQQEQQQYHCWETFTDMLLQKNTTHPFVKPAQADRDNIDLFKIRYQSCVDENFKGFHKDYLWFFYPSTYYLEDKSWYYNGRCKMYLAQKCWPYAWKVDGRWGIVNPHHSQTYPKGLKNGGVDLTQETLQYTYGELGPWDLSHYKKAKHRCQVRSQPSRVSDIDPTCIPILQKRFQQWRNGTFESSIPEPGLPS